MKKIFISVIILILIISCSRENKSLRTDFTTEEKDIIQAAHRLLEESEYLTLVSVDQSGQARARVMEFILPEQGFDIWLGTNPRSRKVEQIRHNPKVTLHCFMPSRLAYVSLMGKAYLENSDSLKQIKWKEGWERFYPDRKKDLLLIHFVPDVLEYIGIVEGYTGDSLTWAPHRVVLRE